MVKEQIALVSRERFIPWASVSVDLVHERR